MLYNIDTTAKAEMGLRVETLRRDIQEAEEEYEALTSRIKSSRTRLKKAYALVADYEVALAKLD